jgi:hypothetical protein
MQLALKPSGALRAAAFRLACSTGCDCHQLQEAVRMATQHMVTETLLRGMYEYWHKVMEDRSMSTRDDVQAYLALVQLYIRPASFQLRRFAPRNSLFDLALW